MAETEAKPQKGQGKKAEHPFILLGDNIQARVEEGKFLVMVVDLSKTTNKGVTAGGNISIATTAGNRTIEGFSVGLNVYQKPEKARNSVQAPQLPNRLR